jgi:hypothetical protein
LRKGENVLEEIMDMIEEEEVTHDRFILENLLISFNISGAKEKANIICTACSSIEALHDYDFYLHGEEKEKVKFAVKAYIKALTYINEYFDTKNKVNIKE